MIDLRAINFDGLGKEIMHNPFDREKKQDIKDVTPR
jgi:hypothetical protein